MWAALGRSLVAFVYPPHCILCERLIQPQEDAPEGICVACTGQICQPQESRCRRCSAPMAEAPCQICVSWPADRSFETAISLGVFDGPLREAIHALKFKHHSNIGRLLGTWLGSSDRLPEFAALLPVPLHPARQRERGYNQAEQICHGISESAEIPVVTGGLRRTRATAQQALTDSAEERAENLAGAFQADIRRLADIPKGAQIGLVDDVLTTGATLDACGRALRAARPDLDLVAVVAALAPREKKGDDTVSKAAVPTQRRR